MVHQSELSLPLRLYLKTYPWRILPPMNAASIRRPIRACRVAIVSSAGLVVPGDEPFDPEVRGGDWSIRVISCDTNPASLVEYHRSDSFDHSGLRADPNLGMPLDRLQELEQQGEIGESAPHHISLMGSITAPGRFANYSVPEIGELLTSDRVDIALLVPV